MASPANIQIIGRQYDQEQLHHRTRFPNILILRMVWERANTARRKAVNCNSVLVTFSHNCEFDLDLWPHDLDLVSTLRSHQYLLYVQVSSRSHYPFMIYKRKKLVGDGRTDGRTEKVIIEVDSLWECDLKTWKRYGAFGIRTADHKDRLMTDRWSSAKRRVC